MDARRRVGLKPTMPLLAAVALSVVGLAAIVLLVSHARDSRDNRDMVERITRDLNALQDMPWRLGAFGSPTAGSLTPSTVRAHMVTIERDATRSLATLQHRSPVTGLGAVDGPLRDNFTTLSLIAGRVGRRELARAGSVVPSAFRTHDAALGLLQRASVQYRARATDALQEATIDSILVVVLLLSGFGFFYRRASKARAAAEALAKELTHSRTHLEQAQRVAGVGSWEWDRREQRMTWSAEQARLHGWRRSELPRSPEEALALVKPEDRPRVEEAMLAALDGRTPIDLEYRVSEAHGGRLIHVQITNVAGEDGRPSRVMGTSQDVTERLRRAEAERANRAKNEFISRMSHELRTPLNAILGFGQLMTMSDLDERQHGNVDHILSAGKHLLDLINEILDISRIEAGELRLSPEPVGLRGVIGEVIDLVTPLASAHAITVTSGLGDEDIWVRADVQRLKQVLLNLVANAVKYNHDRGHVSVTPSPSGPDKVKIVVADDGPGVAPALLDRLFSPFERLGAEQTSVEGTGLGLAVSRGMIEAMGGRISVQSTLGQGSAFTIELDAAASTRLPAAPHTDVAPARSELTATVLCVEDNPSNLSLIEQVLDARPNVRLLTAMQGALGAKLAREQAPDLVLLDLNLPDMSGETVLDDLKADPATASIPVVILSADASAGQHARELAHGAQSYLSKPVDVAELLSLIDSVATEPVRSAA